VNGRVEPAPALRERLMITDQGLTEFGEPDLLLLNDGHGNFTPVSWTGGQFLDEDGKPLSQAPRDWDSPRRFAILIVTVIPIFMSATITGLPIASGSTTAREYFVRSTAPPFGTQARIRWGSISPISIGMDISILL
jgi:hypothetical protein